MHDTSHCVNIYLTQTNPKCNDSMIQLLAEPPLSCFGFYQYFTLLWTKVRWGLQASVYAQLSLGPTAVDWIKHLTLTDVQTANI